MALSTVKQLIEGAMTDIIALTEGEEASADQIEDGARLLSDLIEQWSVEGLLIPYASLTVLQGDTSKASYTWGVGQDINSLAPVNVLTVSFQLENGQTPLERVDDRFMNTRPWVGLIGMPNYFTFRAGSPYPSLAFDCAPYGGAFNIWAEFPLDSTTVLTADLAFAPKYNRALRTSLAIEMCPSFEKTPSQVLIALAQSSKKILKRSNRQPVPNMTTDLPGTIDNSVNLPLRH